MSWHSVITPCIWVISKVTWNCLPSVQQPCLAYVTAATHGLEEKASEYRAVLEEKKLPVRVARSAIPFITL